LTDVHHWVSAGRVIAQSFQPIFVTRVDFFFGDQYREVAP
jgi:hypothetical protein